MSLVLRRFRGLGIALAVLAISAGAVFAAAPPMRPVSSDQGTVLTGDPTESASPSESPEDSESAEPSDSASPSDSPSGSPEASASSSPDNHGALVSTAAQMPTPSGFPNHGAFVSCVARMGGTPSTVDLTTVTPESCGITPAGSAAPATSHGQGSSHATTGKSHGQGHGNSHSGG